MRRNWTGAYQKWNRLTHELPIYIFAYCTLIQIVLAQFKNSKQTCACVYTPSCPPTAYTYFHVCISACSHTHLAVRVSVLWCSQPPCAINQQRGWHCGTEGDITAPCDWSLSLPASFPSYSLVPHSLTPSRMSPVVSSLSSLSLMIPCLQYPCNVLQRGKNSKTFTSWLHVYVTQLNSGKLPDHTRICLLLKFTSAYITCVLHRESRNALQQAQWKNKSKIVDQHTFMAFSNYFIFWHIGG